MCLRLKRCANQQANNRGQNLILVNKWSSSIIHRDEEYNSEHDPTDVLRYALKNKGAW
jgi:hypothetical protein